MTTATIIITSFLATICIILVNIYTKKVLTKYNKNAIITLKVIFSIDATGIDKDITEEINIPSDVCLYCLHDKDNRFYNEVKKALEYKGYNSSYFLQIMKVYVK